MSIWLLCKYECYLIVIRNSFRIYKNILFYWLFDLFNNCIYFWLDVFCLFWILYKGNFNGMECFVIRIYVIYDNIK